MLETAQVTRHPNALQGGTRQHLAPSACRDGCGGFDLGSRGDYAAMGAGCQGGIYGLSRMAAAAGGELESVMPGTLAVSTRPTYIPRAGHRCPKSPVSRPPSDNYKPNRGAGSMSSRGGGL